MEEHPIPQNVTQFEFHLVGDMTLKQFAYLAVGLVAGYVTFLVLSTPLPFLAYPMIFIFVVTGVAFAFLPISERPLDHWVKAYLNAIFSPTQRIYSSDVMKADNPMFADRIALYLDTLPPAEETVKPAPKLGSLSQLAPATQTVIQSSTPPPPMKPEAKPVNPETVLPPPVQAAPAPTPLSPPMPEPAEDANNLSRVVEVAKEAQIIQTEIVAAEKQLDDIKAKAANPGSDVKQYQDNFNKVLVNLQNLNREATTVSKVLADLTNTTPPGMDAHVKVVSAENNPSEKFLVLTTTPNLINGVVTDAQGNYLEGVIVVVHDKDNLPVRALKTNKLGQFLAATPLSNATYTLTLEKDNLNFDVLQIDLDGSVLPAVKIVAKPVGIGG